MPLEPYELDCGCYLRMLEGGVIDEARCADHHQRAVAVITETRRGVHVGIHTVNPLTGKPWTTADLDDMEFGANGGARTKCCTGINGSHTPACPQNTGPTLVCWKCGQSFPADWAAVWDERGSRHIGKCPDAKEA
jgi:hypothetical protein